MRPERISFESYPGSFRIACLCCNNMECTCTTVTFQLVEACAQASQPPLRISIKVDVPTWQEIDAPPRSPQAREVVAEFLRDYPPSERESLKQWFRDRRRIVELLDHCLADPDDVETGIMFTFDEILADTGELVPAFPLGDYDFDWEGQPYGAKERYCLNPDCDCRTVRVSFFKPGSKKDSQGRQIFDECFQAVVSLDGDVRLDKVFSGDRAVAEQVLAKWRKENGRDLDCVDWRYHKMKEIGRRSLEAAGEWEPGAAAPLPPAPPPLRRSPDRVGRNEPCPCGSGKKYKKCCGRGGEAES